MTDARALLRAQLLHLAAREPEDGERVRRFVGFIEAHPNCAERSLQIGHLTGSAWLVDPSGEHVLLTLHRKLDRWLQLGGHADGELNLARVALREASEESGLPELRLDDDPSTRGKDGAPMPFALDDHRIPERPGEPEHTHFDLCYVVRASAELTPVLNNESKELRWWPISDLLQPGVEAFLSRMARRWLDRRRAA
jgi:8-oxo-dGTP pyrophosphatase MutT (NUDIX family)